MVDEVVFMTQNTPIFILPQDTSRTVGRDAQRMNIAAAKLVGETVRTTLGPKGMDKMIVTSNGDIIVTNDGVTILREMNIEHPSAKMIVEVAKTQEAEVGDGTTTAVVLAAQMLKNAEALLDKEIHPTVIARGYRLAAEQADKILKKLARNLDVKDKNLLMKIAHTAMTGKGAEDAKDHLSELVVEAVLAVTDGERSPDRDAIKIEKRTGSTVEATTLIHGIVLDKERVHPDMPSTIKNAKIALIDGALEIKNTEIDAKISITDPQKLQAFLDMEEQMLRRMTDIVIASGANVLICQKGIDELAQHFLAKKGILAMRRVKKSDMERLAKATGAHIVTKIDDLTSKELGSAGVVEEIFHGDEGMMYIRDCPKARAVTILVRGGTTHVIDEVARALEDAVGDLTATVTSKQVVPGAGTTDMAV